MKKFLPFIILSINLVSLPYINSAQAPALGTAANFGLFTITGALQNTGPSYVTGNVGTNAGAYTGFATATVTGQVHLVDPETAQAAADVEAMYNYMSGLPCGASLGPTLGNNQVLTPNTYCIGAASTIEGDLILDAQGDGNAIFIFLINGAFDPGALTNVILINKASMCNVYWRVNGAFSIGANSVFRGNVVVNGAIALYDGAYLAGRAFSRVGAISLFSNNVVSLVTQPIVSIVAGNFTVSDEVLTATVSNAAGPFSYLWSPGGETTSAITVLSNVPEIYTVTVTAMNGCSDAVDNYAISGLLPVKLISFKANCSHQNIDLNWSTAIESNNDYYSIERSANGIAWQTIGIVNGKTHSSGLSNYLFTDSVAYTKILYYRLKQTDLDGRSKYFQTISVNNCSQDLSAFDIYPNPTKGKFKLSYKGDIDQVLSISVYNVLGERVYSSEKYQSLIDLSEKPDGIYILQMNSSSKIMNTRLLIKKSDMH